MNRGLRAKFIRQANRPASPVEIERSADRLYRAHMLDMARKSTAARRGEKALTK